MSAQLLFFAGGSRSSTTTGAYSGCIFSGRVPCMAVPGRDDSIGRSPRSGVPSRSSVCVGRVNVSDARARSLPPRLRACTPFARRPPPSPTPLPPPS
jgi:hypothetical protein